MRCLKKHFANPKVTYNNWFILARMSNTEYSKCIEALGAAGIMDRAIETLREHGTIEHVCAMVLNAVAQWLQMASIRARGVSIPPYDADALLLNIMLAMRRFSTVTAIQSESCFALHGLLAVVEMSLLQPVKPPEEAPETTPDTGDEGSVSPKVEIEDSPIAITMASKGVYELLVAAMQRFPEDTQVALDGSNVLGTIAKQYFADQSRPRNTDACVAMAACLQFHMDNIQVSGTIIVYFKSVLFRSPVSGKRIALPEGGLDVLMAAVETHMRDDSLAAAGSLIIAALCDECMNWDKTSAEYAHFLFNLEDEVLPVLLQALRMHLSSTSEGIVYNVLLGLLSLSRETQKQYTELSLLVIEAMCLHPTVLEIQESGREYLASIE